MRGHSLENISIIIYTLKFITSIIITYLKALRATWKTKICDYRNILSYL